ncbi:MAG: carboxymuconolactone decarboxylase family protein [Pseudomonadota bacterium]|jgi:4-carboxymuconolactone decarboxylase
MSDELFERGLEIRKAVLGADYVENALNNADDFSADFQKLVTEYCWGAGWGRTTLTRRDKSLLNLVMLGLMNRNHEFKLHLKGAITNGCSRDEIRDALIQLAIYGGIPAGVEAFRIARDVFAELDGNGRVAPAP